MINNPKDIEKVRQEIRNLDKETLDKAIKVVEGGSMREIKEIYESLQKLDETILFQVKNRKTLNLMLAEFEKELNSFWYCVYWDKYKEIPIKDIYLFVGRWRLGAAGIFPKHCIYQGEYCHDSYCIDWKSLPNEQWAQEKLVNKFIEIMDKYRKDIKVSRKKYEDVTN